MGRCRRDAVSAAAYAASFVPKKTEAQFEAWTKRPSDKEDERYEWTREQIGKALRSPALDMHSFKVYAKGSYPNHTNVRRDSDVDIAVELTEIIQHDFHHDATGLTLEDLGLPIYAGSYGLAKLKDDVEQALCKQFGAAAIERGNMAIHVSESTRGLKADVVVCESLISHSSRYSSVPGIKIEPDRGRVVHNFPAQHLEQGRAKNTRTQRRFKRVVRILKNLENEMVDKGVINPVASFLIESLVWNVDDSCFLNPTTWEHRVLTVLASIFSYTQEPEPEAERERWCEVNNVQFLFHPHQGWTRNEARNFAVKALIYLELIDG